MFVYNRSWKLDSNQKHILSKTIEKNKKCIKIQGIVFQNVRYLKCISNRWHYVWLVKYISKIIRAEYVNGMFRIDRL